MSDYLSKWKTKYKLRAPYDLLTGEFIRNPDGSLDTNDIYIECQGEDQIYDVDSRKSILEAYIASKQRGRRIVSEIYSTICNDFERFVSIIDYTDSGEEQQQRKEVDWDGFYFHVNSLKNNLIYDVYELDDEVVFKFNGNKHIHTIAKFVKAKKPMSSTSPFNSKFLPSHKEKLAQKKLDNARYIPYDKMDKGYWNIMMQEIIPTMARKYECKIDVALEKCYKLFSKHKKINCVKLADENNYKINHYLHSLGLWSEFIEFLKLHIKS